MTTQSLFEKFGQYNVLIIGDVMIDSYVWGKVNRISPEAPVPIVHTQRSEKRLGGAANVARNIKALGANPILCALIGTDSEASDLESLLTADEMSTKGIIKSEHRVTTIKHRIMAGSQHIVRIDAETDVPASGLETTALIQRVESLIDQVDIIIFEDYDKGVLTEESISAIIKMANERGIPTSVDPKKRNFFAYKNCSLFKPNLKELKEGLNINLEGTNIEGINDGIAQLNKAMPVEKAMITLSEHGVIISDNKEFHHIPAHKREIADVSGAGDTVISIASLCLAAKLPMEFIAGISNLGGGLVCEHLGVVPIDKELLKTEVEKIYGQHLKKEVV